MIVTVKNDTALQLALTARATKGITNYATNGVMLDPGGALAGTDGFCAVYHPSAVEPFEGERLIIEPLAKVPALAAGFTFDTETQMLSWTIKGAASSCACRVHDEQFPDVERVVPTTTKAAMLDAIGFNVDYAAKFAKILKNPHMYWELTGGTGPMVLNYPADADLRVLLMPLRTDGLSYVLPRG